MRHQPFFATVRVFTLSQGGLITKIISKNSLVLSCPLRFQRKRDVRFVFTPNLVFRRRSCFICFICIYLRLLVPSTIAILDDFSIFDNNTTGATRGAGFGYRSRASEFIAVISGVGLLSLSFVALYFTDNYLSFLRIILSVLCGITATTLAS